MNWYFKLIFKTNDTNDKYLKYCSNKLTLEVQKKFLALFNKRKTLNKFVLPSWQNISWVFVEIFTEINCRAKKIVNLTIGNTIRLHSATSNCTAFMSLVPVMIVVIFYHPSHWLEKDTRYFKCLSRDENSCTALISRRLLKAWCLIVL